MITFLDFKVIEIKPVTEKAAIIQVLLYVSIIHKVVHMMCHFGTGQIQVHYQNQK